MTVFFSSVLVSLSLVKAGSLYDHDLKNLCQGSGGVFEIQKARGQKGTTGEPS